MEPMQATLHRWQYINLRILILIASLVLGACSSAPRYRTIPDDGGDRRPIPAERAEIIEVAKSYLGTPYRSGGTSRNGVDCSGFVTAVYRQFNIRLPRTSLDQSVFGERISTSKLEPADLVFFKTSRRQSVSHVGIYVGKGKFIHASTRSRKVRFDDLSDDYFRKRFVVARRIVSG
jgi:cell wall-associated NlpC family hydrolase